MVEAITMKKRTYRRTDINDFDPRRLQNGEGGPHLILAIDVAKRDMVAALTTKRGDVLATLCWKHLEETPLLLKKLVQLRELGYTVEAVMESTGTYGDVLRHQLESHGLVVFQVSGKRVHDAKVVYDGVASLHDAKCAAIIAKLHVDGRSSVWEQKTAAERELKAAVATMDVHQGQYLRLVHQLESWLARYWPEVTQLVELTSATLLATLGRIGGPRDVTAEPEATRKLMTGMSHRLMKPEKIEQVIECAARTAGLELLPGERGALMVLASEAHRSLRAFKAAKALDPSGTLGGNTRLSRPPWVRRRPPCS